MKKSHSLVIIVLAASVMTPACAALGGLMQMVQAPRLESFEGRQAELRFLGPSSERPYGGAALRLWAKVENPNPFGITLSTVEGSLFLEEEEAAEIDLPLGLPLEARQETVVPIDLSVDLDDVPGLAHTIARAVTGSGIAYRIDGTIGVDAGDFGEPTFGPLTVLEGEVRVR